MKIDAINNFIEEIISNDKLSDKHKIMFKECINNTFTTTIKKTDLDDYFVLTGDIPAMWLRDSSGQLRPFLYIDDPSNEVDKFIKGVIKRQFFNINIDPYANAFNQYPNGHNYHLDKTKSNAWVWERKYEIDSLCFPIQTAYLYWKKTCDASIFDSLFLTTINTILDVFETEQHHVNSSYSFQRDEAPLSDTLSNKGKGSPVAYTGMSWSGFRASDDACMYGYLIPSNMFIVVVMNYIIEIFEQNFTPEHHIYISRATKLRDEVENGIKKYGVVDSKFGPIYAYEVDGLGNYNLMDDANVPSLLSLPYLGYCSIDHEIYQNTRKYILSKNNPYYYEGLIAKGIGSPHTPPNYIWHIALAIQGMTSNDEDEIAYLLNQFTITDAATNLVHEGFDVNNPSNYTRDWFSWSNSMYCEFIIKYLGYKLIE